MYHTARSYRRIHDYIPAGLGWLSGNSDWAIEQTLMNVLVMILLLLYTKIVHIALGEQQTQTWHQDFISL